MSGRHVRDDLADVGYGVAQLFVASLILMVLASGPLLAARLILRGLRAKGR